MKTPLNFAIVLFISLHLFSCFSESNSIIEYMDKLSEEITQCTNDKEYDIVYKKIINLKNDERFNNLRDENEKKEATMKMLLLTQEALAAKAILYVLPQSTTITPDDMKFLLNECISKNLNVMMAPYSEVKKLVYDYCKISK